VSGGDALGKTFGMHVPQEPVSEALRRLTAAPRPDERAGRNGGLTKQELYERAKQLDIPRRSAMTKDELARAIARREG
jgi:hypothetical protein